MYIFAAKSVLKSVLKWITTVLLYRSSFYLGPISTSVSLQPSVRLGFSDRG